MARTRVLVIDDAVVVRRLVTKAIEADPALEVAGVAANGRIGLARIAQLNPDAVTLDIEMPEMDGLETLRELRREWPRLPVIMFSTLTERGATATLDALTLGASDYVTKPSNMASAADAIERVSAELVPKIKALCPGHGPAAGARALLPVGAGTQWAAAPARSLAPRRTGPVDLVAIGLSTGGPNALSDLLPSLPGDFPVPVVIVQHMPPVFTRFLAERLDSRCPVSVKEAAAGDVLAPGHVYIAPGGSHTTVEARAGALVLATNEDPPENSCRPAVDVLFRSVAAACGGRVLAAVLTGMGQDGLRGSELIVEAGGQVIAQDEASSVVWGMPGFVARAGLADAVVPLDRMSDEIQRRVAASRARVGVR